MAGFAEREARYLWTDAFAVCNYLALAAATGESAWRTRALELVSRVHHVLGRYRPGDARTGWLSGLGMVDAEAHPTLGGLRIGKPLPERGPAEPFDERLEWERDGQYFHYLTQWMHALDQVAQAAGDGRFNTWARELAQVAHAAFTFTRGTEPRMVWKKSVDLQRALVPSMGQHDPLDGYVACLELEVTARRLGVSDHGPSLSRPARDFEAMLASSELATNDPLGLGVLLADAHRLARLAERGEAPVESLVARLVRAAGEGLSAWTRFGEDRLPAAQRIAFRELGLALGLAAVPRSPRLASLARYAPLGEALTSFWLDPANRANQVWTGHRDINEVMLATALLPDGYLDSQAERVGLG
jgi:hypothetical protein